jgi:S1-C subfamily serine protease
VTLQGGSAIGSGVIIDKRGYVVTNNHVVDGAQSIQVVMSDSIKPLNAQLVGTDPADDLAVLRITPPLNMVVATLGDSSNLRVGQEVLAIGNPLGINETVTHGIVSALGRSVSEGAGGATIPNAIQTDAPINPGNSGGALVDLQGNLVGIPTLTAIDPEFRTPANGVGFAIPSNRVNLIVPQIIQSGKVTHTGRAALGVRVASVDQGMQQRNNLAVDHGALIAEVVSGGAAARAGLQSGDVIVQVDDKAVNDSSSLGDALAGKNPGDTVSVKIYRGNQQLTMNVTLGELQAGS